MVFVRNLPWYAQTEQVPREWKFFAAATLVPLLAGGVAVHYLPTKSESPPIEESDFDLARKVLGWDLHYASLLVGAQAGLHWGMQAINFGQPTHTLEYTPLYRFMRFGLPIVPLTVSILASRLSIENPRAASVLLLCVLAASTGVNFFAFAFATCPIWFTKFQWQLSAGIASGLLLLMLSERMKLVGELRAIEG